MQTDFSEAEWSDYIGKTQHAITTIQHCIDQLAAKGHCQNTQLGELHMASYTQGLHTIREESPSRFKP